MNDLELFRKQINEIDEKLVELFLKRLQIVSQVGVYKKANNIPILDIARERQIIEKYMTAAESEAQKKYIREFMENLLFISRKVQSDMYRSDGTIESAIPFLDIESRKIGYQGIKGCFSHQACLEYFGDSVEAVSFESFREVFDSIEEGNIKYGVLPIENSSSGSITEVYDLLREYNFYILGEKCLKIEHNLLAVPGAEISDIKEVYSHQQGLLQCDKFLLSMPHIKPVPYFDTAGSALYVSREGEKSKACIAGKNAASIYGLNVLRENIQSNMNNFTRFIIIGKDLEICRDADKISVIISLPHKVGALHGILRYFDEYRSNMQKIESRPIMGKSWQYFFYIDFMGNVSEEYTKRILAGIEKDSLYYRFLGNYRNGADCR